MKKLCILLTFLAASIGATEDLTGDFEEQVLESEIPVVVEIYTKNCPPCNKQAPIIDSLSEELQGVVKFVKIEYDTYRTLGQEPVIQVLPTLLLYKEGRFVGKQGGFRDKTALLALIDELLER